MVFTTDYELVLDLGLDFLTLLFQIKANETNVTRKRGA
jgi:hypothetical protein